MILKSGAGAGPCAGRDWDESVPAAPDQYCWPALKSIKKSSKKENNIMLIKI